MDSLFIYIRVFLKEVHYQVRVFGLVHGLKVSHKRSLEIFERCSLCTSYLHIYRKVKSYYGGIDDIATKKTYHVCMQCFDWFHKLNANEKKVVIRNGRIVFVEKYIK